MRRSLARSVLVLALWAAAVNVSPHGTPSSAANDLPVLATERSDYRTGEFVVVTGTGLAPSTAYDISIVRPDGSAARGGGSMDPFFRYECPFADAAACVESVTTDHTGRFEYTWLIDGSAGTYRMQLFESGPNSVAPHVHGGDAWTFVAAPAGSVEFRVAPSRAVPANARDRKWCGNGVVEGAEQCDDGNQDEQDGCRNHCLPPAAAAGAVGPFSDDFDACSLDDLLGNGWVVRDPLGSATVEWVDDGTDAFVRFSMPSGFVYDAWSAAGNTALQLLQPVAGLTAFDVEVGFLSLPENAFDIQGIIFEEDADTFMRADIFRVANGNLRLFVGAQDGATRINYLPNYNIADAQGQYLRVSYDGTSGAWRVFTSADGIMFTEQGESVDILFSLDINWIGLAGGNPPVTGGSNAYVAEYDYFLNLDQPFDPSEDGADPVCPVCGNGELEAGEGCDDGNTTPGDGCDESCGVEDGPCGDGVLNVGEECDDAGESATCDIDCTFAACGDGRPNPTAGEACDDGNTAGGDGCSADCTSDESCGNGVVDPGEGCDDGNADEGDGCSAVCGREECGNGVVDPGEVCDDGNTVGGDGCSANCMSDESCGNGLVDVGEACDDGNGDNTDACLVGCIAASCGDGFVQAGVEECDDANGNNTDACLDTCVEASCGDGFVQAGVEACDDGNAANTDVCLDTCVEASCGDGFVQTGVEACDDGNALNTDACLDTCVAATCGDGFVYAGVEECDDANGDNTDACLDTCVEASCGDGFVHAGVEACDDGNAANSDACLDTCVEATCGDGFVQTGVEACDDGNALNTDACLDTCVAATCGDGLVRAGVEACDDGNATDGDGCDSNCTATGCGNGIVTGLEVCDDGNTLGGDGCSADCASDESCGNGIVDPGEDCDDGNTVGGDDCDADCNDGGELFVLLDSFTAEPAGNGVRLRWTTAVEIDNAGFRLLRGVLSDDPVGRRGADAADKARRVPLETISPLIPSRGNDLEGAAYEFDDVRAPRGTLVYWLEDIDLHGRVTRHGPLTVEFPAGRAAPAAGRAE